VLTAGDARNPAFLLGPTSAAENDTSISWLNAGLRAMNLTVIQASRSDSGHILFVEQQQWLSKRNNPAGRSASALVDDHPCRAKG
jgi:hypothetical protein